MSEFSIFNFPLRKHYKIQPRKILQKKKFLENKEMAFKNVKNVKQACSFIRQVRLSVYISKNCPSQFLSHWELAQSVFCSEELSFLPHYKIVSLKISKFQNVLLVSSNLPKNQQKISRISALVSKKRSNQKSSVRKSK